MEANLESTERTSGTFLMLKKYQITRQINVNCLMHVKNDKRVCTLLSFLIPMTFHDFFEELSQFYMALVLAAIFENYILLVFEIILLQTQHKLWCHQNVCCLHCLITCLYLTVLCPCFDICSN